MRLYAFLLRLFPREFRDRFGHDMAEVFADQWRLVKGRGIRASIGFIGRATADTVSHAAAERRRTRVPASHSSIAQRGLPTMDGLLQNIRCAGRSFAQRPGMTTVAIVTIALGIGANAAIFSAVHAVLLRSLPYPSAERLVSLYATHKRAGFTRGVENPKDIRYWQEHATSLERIAPLDGGTVTLTGAGDPARLRFAGVTPDFFNVMAVPPELGRPFTDAETVAGERVVVISHAMWHSRLGGRAVSPDLSIALNGEPWRVIGVMPASFAFPDGIDLWRPFDFSRAESAWYLGAVARLKPSVSVEDAQREMDQLAADLERESPKTRKDRGFNVVSLREDIAYRVTDGLRLLQGVVGLVLLIACANVANLLLAQSSARRREFAVRAAIGASRWQILQQLLTESLVLSSAGAIAGIGLASLGVRVLVALAPSTLLPESAAVSVSWPVVAFTAALAVVTGLVFGIAPAMLASRPDLTAALGQGARLSSGGVGVSRTQWLRSGLVAAEMALALILLAGSGLLVRSFMLLSAQQTGFQSDRILTAMVTLPPARYPTGDARKQFWLELGSRLQTLPGVSESIESTALPFSNWEWQYDFTVKGREGVPNDGAGYRVVSGNYFTALGIPLLRGRVFTSRDAPGAEPAMIVSDVFAAKHLGAADPVGQQIGIGKTWRTVVGVVGSTRHRGLDEDLRAEMYVPLSQESAAPSSMLFAVKTQSDPNALLPGVRATLTQMDPLLPLESVKTMEQLISATVAERRFLMALLTLFAAVAALLAAIGVYGVMTFVVNHSRRAIGIRLALGARPSQVQRAMVRSAATVVVAGAVAGLFASLMISKLIASQLFVISPRDPWTLTAVSLVLIAGALLSCWLPTRATSRVDPSIALRID